MSQRQQLANLIFPNIKHTINDLANKYPKRNLPNRAYVTRFAPSPTGFLHTGSLFTAMIAEKVAKDSGGVFFLRLEDTDTKREISGSGTALIEELAAFNIQADEGYLGDKESGNYGPYKQSERKEIYQTVIKEMLIRDLAYPCFMSSEQLSELRESQMKANVIPGYYGIYARDRNLSSEEAINKINNGEQYVIRFKSNGNHELKIKVNDLIRGELELSENDQDIVIMKNDQLPTYHFAHVVDDHLMQTNLVTRGEEWLSSLPIHLELFNALGWAAPEYAHLPLIHKLDEGKKRKLSKRKDPEAAVSYFLSAGYPPRAIINYLMSIANSNFEEWWSMNKEAPLSEFKFEFSKMSLEGALFDLDKVNFFAKEIIAAQTAEQLANDVKSWSKQYQPELFQLIERDFNYFVNILNIEREIAKPRKDYTNYKDILPAIKFFYDDYYLTMIETKLPFKETFSNQQIINIINALKNDYAIHEDETSWFNALKETGEKLNFAPSNKIYKKNPELYQGHVGDLAEIYRIVITTSTKSPNLFAILNVLGPDKVFARFDLIIEKLSL